MKNTTTVAQIQVYGSQNTSPVIGFVELTQAEIEYAMRKEEACRKARAAKLASNTQLNHIGVIPGPGGWSTI